MAKVSQIPYSTLNDIVNCKVDIANIRAGQDLHKIKMAVKNYRKATIDTDDFIIKSDAT